MYVDKFSLSFHTKYTFKQMSKYDIYDEIYINAGKAIVNMKSIGRGVGEPGVALRRLSPAEEVESNGVRTRGKLPPTNALDSSITPYGLRSG